MATEETEDTYYFSIFNHRLFTDRSRNWIVLAKKYSVVEDPKIDDPQQTSDLLRS